MNDLNQLFFGNRQAFRTWLTDNHLQSPGIWMVFHKKHTAIPGITYSEALEEALCFGWIDSLVKKLDEERYVRKFTPRSDKSGWSDINLKLAERLIKEGKMTESGFVKFRKHKERSTVSGMDHHPSGEREEPDVPDFLLESLSLNEPALTHFLNLPPSCKKQYIGWIMQAKRRETILKRTGEAIVMLKENKRLGIK